MFISRSYSNQKNICLPEHMDVKDVRWFVPVISRNMWHGYVVLELWLYLKGSPCKLQDTYRYSKNDDHIFLDHVFANVVD